MYKNSPLTIKRGFTLVELSIVLVIIGLLIGGILVGQSLIESSKINATAQQIQQFDAGVMAFKAKYKSIPGDSAYFGGSGEGALTSFTTIWDGSNYLEARAFSGEIARFWKNFDPNTYVSGSQYTRTSGNQKNVPKSKMGKDDSFFIASGLSINGYHLSGNRNPRTYYAIFDPSQAKTTQSGNVFFDTTTSANSAVKPQQLLSLDQKLDDGVANTGYVMSGANGNFGSNFGGIIATPLATCSSGAIYVVANDTNECTPLIRMGAQAGNPL